MSTIKSSAEHLTVTSDGTNKHTYIQDNGATKVATTTTGIDVTGDYVNSGGLYSDSNSSLKIISGGNASNAGSNLTLYGGTNASAGTFRFRNGTSVVAEIDSAGRVTMPYQPSFNANAATTNIPIATQTTVTLTERNDTGSNLTANVFTAPVTGKYLLTYMFYFTNVDSAHTTLDVVINTSNKVYQTTFKPSIMLSSDGNFSTSGAQICDMDANDTAYYRVYVSGGTAQTDIHTDSTASGHLLA